MAYKYKNWHNMVVKCYILPVRLYKLCFNCESILQVFYLILLMVDHQLINIMFKSSPDSNKVASNRKTTFLVLEYKSEDTFHKNKTKTLFVQKDVLITFSISDDPSSWSK